MAVAFGLVLIAVGLGAGLYRVESHGVRCGNAFVDSSQPLAADLAHLNATNTYNEATSAVVRCGRARDARAAISYTVMAAGLLMLALSLLLFIIDRVQRASSGAPHLHRP
ncbi:MAG: hypothetical protein ACR2N4_10495 [Jatrophihabitans sp.]